MRFAIVVAIVSLGVSAVAAQTTYTPGEYETKREEADTEKSESYKRQVVTESSRS